MPFAINILILLFISNFSIAQSNNTIQVSICIQHANTYQQILGASVIIKELDSNNEIMNIASMYSAIFTPTNFQLNHKYQIIIEKKGFHPLDTIIIPQVTSTSNKQRLGLFLRPIICYHIKGNVVEAGNFQKIETGKIILKDLHTNLFSEAEIKDGYYEFCGINGHHYHLTTRIEGHLHQSKNIELHPNPALKHDEQEMTLNWEVLENYDKSLFEGDSITVHGLTFVDETTTLSSQGEKEINRLILVMKQMPHLMLSIAVQTEIFMETRYNRKLAEQRAKMIEHKLNLGGISPHRYLLICCGKVDANAPESCKNQRVCLWLRK